MNLGLWIYTYRKEHSMSMQAMADLCGLSKQYISVLEKGINPNTKKKFIPSIETVKKISDATGTEISVLISMLDGDQEFIVNSAVPFPDFKKIRMFLSAQEHELITDFRKLNAAGQTAAAATVKSFAQIDMYAKKEKETG